MSINKKVVAIWPIGTISLVLLSPPAMGQDDPNVQRTELTRLRSTVKSQAVEIAQLKAENAKLAGQIKRLEELCSKASIPTSDAVPATAPAKKSVMTLADVARVMRDATAKDKTHLQRKVALKGLDGQDVQGTMTIKSVAGGGGKWATVYGRSPEFPFMAILIPESEGLKLSEGKQVSFIGKIMNFKGGGSEGVYVKTLSESQRKELGVSDKDPHPSRVGFGIFVEDAQIRP